VPFFRPSATTSFRDADVRNIIEALHRAKKYALLSPARQAGQSAPWNGIRGGRRLPAKQAP